MSGDGWFTTGYEELESDPRILLPEARIRGHDAFDRIWGRAPTYRGKQQARSACYAWLAEQLGITAGECHFKLFDAAMCEKAIDLCQNMDWKKLHQWMRNRSK